MSFAKELFERIAERTWWCKVCDAPSGSIACHCKGYGQSRSIEPAADAVMGGNPDRVDRDYHQETH